MLKRKNNKLLCSPCYKQSKNNKIAHLGKGAKVMKNDNSLALIRPENQTEKHHSDEQKKISKKSSCKNFLSFFLSYHTFVLLTISIFYLGWFFEISSKH